MSNNNTQIQNEENVAGADTFKKSSKSKKRSKNRTRSSKNQNKANSNSQASSSDKGPLAGRDPMIKWKARGSNDPSWYTPDSQLVNDVASLSYGYPTGAKESLGQYAPELNKYGTPGIMTLNFFPTFGELTSHNSPTNVSFDAFFKILRYKNSKNADYDSDDLALYILALDQIYMWMAYTRRMYDAMNVSSQVNKYVPQALVDALGGSYSDLHKHCNDFRGYWNRMAVQINTYPVPNIFKIFDRHCQLCSEVYADGKTPKAQFYAFKPTAVYQYALDAEGQGKLTPYPLINLQHDPELDIGLNYDSSTTGLTFDTFVTITESLLNSFRSMGDWGQITGDIEAAYGPESMRQLQFIPENEGLFIVPDAEMINQIQNASMMGIRVGGDIVQNNGIGEDYLTQYLQYKTPYFMRSGNDYKYYAPNAFLTDRYLNVDLPKPTPSDNMVASRLTNIGSGYDASTGTFDVFTRGSEVVEFAIIYRWKYSSPYGCTLVKSRAIFTALCDLIPVSANATAAQVAQQFIKSTVHNMINLLSMFEYHPAVYCTRVMAEQNTANPSIESYSTFDSVAFDLGNYTIVNEQQLIKMSDCAMRGLMGFRGYVN